MVTRLYSYIWGISILARVLGKQSGRCHFQSGPPQANSLILPEACHDSEMKKRGCWKEFQGAYCAHDDTACVRILTESGIML